MIPASLRRLKRRAPAGLLGMLALIACVERFVARHALDFGTPTAADWRQSSLSARKKAPKADVLLFGDSMIKFGVLPRVLEARLGRPSFSLALYNGTPQTSFVLLKRALDSGSRPAAIVVDFQPELLMADHIALHPRQWPEILSLPDLVDLARTAYNPDFLARTELARIFPSIKDRQEIRAGIVAALQGQSLSPRLSLMTYQRNWRANFGAQVLAKNPSYAGEVPPTYALFFDAWEAKPLNAAYVRKFLKLAERRDIPVFWVLPPNVPPVQAKRAAIGLTARYDRFIHTAVDKYANLHVLDARQIGFEHDKFIDAVHLDRDGATELTSAVAEAISASLAGQKQDRWVAVVGPKRQEGIPLEDVNESRLALERVGAFR